MATNKLESLSLKELNEEKQKKEKFRKGIIIIWSVIAVLTIITVIWRLQQGAKFSSVAPPSIVILILARLSTNGANKKIKDIDKEIQKRS